MRTPPIYEDHDWVYLRAYLQGITNYVKRDSSLLDA